jgi:hypothetical protein
MRKSLHFAGESIDRSEKLEVEFSLRTESGREPVQPLDDREPPNAASQQPGSQYSCRCPCLIGLRLIVPRDGSACEGSEDHQQNQTRRAEHQMDQPGHPFV